MRTQVGIVGAGPAGLTLALLLKQRGIDAVILELRDRTYVEQRVRAGLLEHNTVELFRALGVASRLDREGLVHDGIYLRRERKTLRIPITDLTGRTVTVYGQQEVVKDLIAAWLQRGGDLQFEVSDVSLNALDGKRAHITYTQHGTACELECDYIAGCDGFHGVSRTTIPAALRIEHEYVYPFAWLGILAEAQPATDELIYAWHERGFALYSMRSPTISRLYLQTPADEQLEDWSHDRIWSELQDRLAADDWRVNEGPIFDVGITPMRSFVCETMRYQRLLLVGDAAHIVPPTGAKGLNLAVNDARLLASALADTYETGDESALDAYPSTALRRVWRAQDFSNYMTQLLHDLGQERFQQRLQLSRLDYLSRSQAYARSLAENYAGLPATPDF
jgi:p-hydroxybenzoate 3-monooxygenase